MLPDRKRNPEHQITATSNVVVSPMGFQSFDQYRVQLYNYALQAERIRFAAHNYGQTNGFSASICPSPMIGGPCGPRWAFPMSILHHRLQPDEPKPQHSYIGLIAMAILSSPESKLVLSDIYQYILENYPYFRTRGPGWRNSIRHNLSLNDCFIKAGRSANGKGHYWAVHPANVDDFKKGDFRRRKAQRKVRKHMGLAVDDDGNDSPSPPPTPPPSTMWTNSSLVFPTFPTTISRKRQFDVASLLAPDDNLDLKRSRTSSTSGEDDEVTEIDVTTDSTPMKSTTPNATSGPPMVPPWCYPIGPVPTVLDHHLVTKYYEQLNHARTLQFYSQFQMQRRSSLDPEEGSPSKLHNNTI